VEAVRLYEDAAWVAEHFHGDSKAAANFLEQKYFPRLWQGSHLDFARLREVLRRFPDLADWQRCEFSPVRLSDQMEAEERALRQQQEQQPQERARQAEWQACQDYVDQGLRDRLLLHIRGGDWHPTYAVGPALEKCIDPAMARRRYVLDNGEDDREAGMIAHGKGLLLGDAIRQAQEKNLLAVEDRGDAGVFIRSTPRQDARFTVDAEFARELPRSPAEVAHTEALLLAEGCRDKLVIWKDHGLLVDGHTRFALCALLGRTYDLDEKEFADRSAVKAWMWDTHRSRRNLSEEAKSYGRGRQFNARQPQRRGGDHKSKKSNSQRENSKSVADELACKHHVSRATIYRDGRFQVDLDRVAAICGREIRDRVLSRELKWTRGDVERLAKLSVEELRAVVQAALQSGKRPALPRNRPNSAVRLPAGSRHSRVEALIAYLGEKEAAPFSRLMAKLLRKPPGDAGPTP
jgi:hypothetical protein